ncbi:MAG TPA: HAMP domain-containing sensor histidine kinase [Ktedonobacteraceae bacterium]
MSKRDGHLQLPRSFWISVGIAILFNSLFLALVLVKPGTERQFVISDDVGQAIGWLLATLFCFVGFKELWLGGKSVRSSNFATSHRLLTWVPIFIAIGIFCQFIGQVIYTYYDIRGWPPFPSWADAGYLSTFPFMLVAILLLPRRRLTGTTRSRVLLDGLIIMTAVITFSWYFILGPTMLQGAETNLAKVVGSAYPVFDLILIFCMLLLWFRESDPSLIPAERLLLAGLTIIVITDSVYGYLTLQNIYTNGLQDIGWPVGYMLLGLAAQCVTIAYVMYAKRSETTSVAEALQVINSKSRLGKHSLLPYALIPAVIALSAFIWRSGGNGTLEQGVYFGGIVLIGLLLLRQFFVLRETTFYNKQLRVTQQDLYEKNQALREANSQLEEQSTQVEAAYNQQVYLNELKDDFLLNVNHELRTPLTAIYGFLDLMREYHGQLDSSMELTLINQAVSGCEELQQLVSNVLDTLQGDIKGKEPTSEVFSIATVADEVINLFEPQKKLDNHISMMIPENLFVVANKQYVHQVLLNLLSNAFKYSPMHTPIEISARLYDNSTAEGNVQSLVCVSVQDAGPGIPASEARVLFGKFVRLKRDLVGSVRGTGLGLYISKQLVEAMGGNIWVESSGIAGQGSRFSFTLLHADPEMVEQNGHSVPNHTEILTLSSTNMIHRDEQIGVVRSKALEP